MMRHTKFQGSILYLVVLDKKMFSHFSYIILCNANFNWPQAYNFNKLSAGLLNDATNQISSFLSMVSH